MTTPSDEVISADSGSMFHPEYNTGLTPDRDFAEVLKRVYGNGGPCGITRRSLLAYFGYKRLGSVIGAVIEQCLAERGIDLSASWRSAGIDETVWLSRDDRFFEANEVARRLRTEIDLLVARTMRVKYRDILLLCGHVRKTKTARESVADVMRLAKLEMDDTSSGSWVYIRPKRIWTRSSDGPGICQPEDWWTSDRADAEKAAKARLRTYHHDDWLSDEQQELAVRFLEGRHTFGILPTGSGKSLCFALPAEILGRHGVTLVVSPLIALMADQNKFDRPGVTFFNSTLTQEEYEARRTLLYKGKYHLVYVTPERLGSEVFLRTLIDSKKPVIRVAIDEAHCVSLWGHSFRPEYLLLRDALRRLGKPPTLLLTATAPEDMRADISNQLGLNLKAESDIVHGFYRRLELSPDVQRVNGTAKKYQALKRFIRERLKYNPAARGIIFTQYATAGVGDDRRENCEEIRQRIAKQHSVGVAIYHGQLSAEEKAKQQAHFTEGDAQILIATNAFGLGIDLPSVDWIAHFYMPPSILDYYQEIGRGGRKMDHEQGDKCFCLILYDSDDRGLAEDRVFGSLASPDKIELRFRQMLKGERRQSGLRGPHEVLYDSHSQLLYLPFRPVQYTVRISHLLVLQEIGIVERLPKNAYHDGAAYAQFRVKREALSPDDRARLDDLYSKRRNVLTERLDKMEQFCRLPDEHARWDVLHEYFAH